MQRVDENDPHRDCWVSEPCEAKDPAHCPHEAKRRQRAAFRARALEGAWSKLEVRKQGGGLRHYLDGEPVHCGEGLELQAIEYRHNPDDRDDDNPVAFVQQKGRGVRYEASQDGRTIRATLYTVVDGHSFVTGVEPWMRFRWPVRS